MSRDVGVKVMAVVAKWSWQIPAIPVYALEDGKRHKTLRDSGIPQQQQEEQGLIQALWWLPEAEQRLTDGSGRELELTNTGNACEGTSGCEEVLNTPGLREPSQLVQALREQQAQVLVQLERWDLVAPQRKIRPYEELWYRYNVILVSE